MTTKPTEIKHVEREARLRWIPLAEMAVNPLAQRDLKQSRVNRLVRDFDPEQVGSPTVSHRGAHYYIVDGQHRVEALKIWLGDDWTGQQLQCWCYENLTEEQEAEVFLKLNDVLTVNSFAKFKVGVQAGRTEESDIDRIVRAVGLKVSQGSSNGSIGAVEALRRVYRRGVLARTLRIIRDSYGDLGMEGPVIEGLGLVCQRYDGQLSDDHAISRFSGTPLQGLLGRAEVLSKQTNSPKTHCLAAAIVDVLNTGTGKKLPSWWKADS